MTGAVNLGTTAHLEGVVLTLADGRSVGLGVYGAEDGARFIALHGTPACRIMYAIADAAARRHGWWRRRS
mgnify:CR=1 FL=1